MLPKDTILHMYAEILIKEDISHPGTIFLWRIMNRSKKNFIPVTSTLMESLKNRSGKGNAFDSFY